MISVVLSLSWKVCGIIYVLYSASKEIRSFPKWSLTIVWKQCKIIWPLRQKVVAVAYWRWSFMGGCNYRALTGKILLYWMVAYGKCLLTRGGCTWRFNCNILLKGAFVWPCHRLSGTNQKNWGCFIFFSYYVILQLLQYSIVVDTNREKR